MQHPAAAVTSGGLGGRFHVAADDLERAVELLRRAESTISVPAL